MTTEKFKEWRRQLFQTKDISPLRFGMTQEDVVAEFGRPDTISTVVRDGRPLAFKYGDIELHFDDLNKYKLYLVYTDESENMSIMGPHFPYLFKGQVALSRAIFSTGQLLDTDFKLYKASKGGEIYSVFDSLNLAKKYIAEQHLLHEGVEMWVYGKGQEVIYYSKPD